MPTMTEDQRHALLVYLNIEGFRAGAMTAIDNDIVDLLNDNGYSVPTYQTGAGSGNPMFGGNKQYSKHVQTHFTDTNIQNWMGLADEGEADNYTRRVVAAPAKTGDSKSAKRNSRGDPLPARVLKPEMFDHNGMMAKNILSIASTGMPEAAWIAAAKKVAAGANYLSEFPANLGDTYALGSRGVHPSMGATTPTPAPAPTPTPVVPAAPAPTQTPVVEEEVVVEEPAEVIEEVTAPAGTKYFDGVQVGDVIVDPVKTGRALNDATWAARDGSMGGKYPYDVTKQSLIINLAQHPQNALLQPPVTAKNIELDLFGDSEELTITEVDASPEAFFFVQNDLFGIHCGQSDFFMLSDTVETVEVVWERNTDNITGVVVKDTSGQTLIQVSQGIITTLLMQDQTNSMVVMDEGTEGIWCSPELIYDVSELDPLTIIYAGPKRTDAYGISTVSSARDDYNEALNDIRDQGYGFAYYSPKVEVMGSLGVYEGGVTDFDSTLRDENYWLSRVITETSDVVDMTQTYIAVNLVFDMDTSTTTDLFNGGPEKTKMETLIFPGDEQDLDIMVTPYADKKTVMAELKIDSEGLRALMLDNINTSPATPAMDEDGTALGYSLVSDADLNFVNMATSKTLSIHIPNPDDEFAAVDLLGQTLRGRVESVELHTGDAAGAYQKQKAIRRQQRMSEAFNIRNGSKSDENATAAVAFSKGNKYYIVGRHNGKPVMVELELDF
tara:strand:+ start:14637 stop:16808 length:2172 start_codon:yes stop_codon:yes gene_type:complete